MNQARAIFLDRDGVINVNRADNVRTWEQFVFERDVLGALEKLAQTERIMFDVLKQIWQDHYGPNAERATTPFQYFHFDKLQIMPVGPLFDNQFGWRVEFAFDLRQNISIVEPPAPGTFL